jgi:hypothetical protein
MGIRPGDEKRVPSPIGQLKEEEQLLLLLAAFALATPFA